MNIVSYAEGMALYLASKQEAGPCGRRLFRLAESKFDGAVRSTPDNQATLDTYADVLRDRAARAADEDSLALYSKAFEKYCMARNWAQVATLGHHLVDVCPQHWRCQDVLLGLATACFETAAAAGGEAGEVGRRALGRVMVTRAALRHDAALHRQAGAIFQRDPAALGLLPEDATWLARLEPPELAALAETLNRSPALAALDTRWLMSPAACCTPAFLRHVLGNGPRLTAITLDFSHRLPVVRVYEDELSPTVFMPPSAAGTSLDALFDGVLDSATVAALAAELPPPALHGLTQLTIARQAGVEDAALAALVERCPGLTHLSLRGCSKAGQLTYAAIGRSCKALLELSLAGTGHRASSRDLLPACGGLTALVLARTRWAAPDEYCAVLGACAGSLRELDLSHVRDLDAGVTDCVAERLVALEALRLDGCSYLPDAALARLLQALPALAALTLPSAFDLTDASLTAGLRVGGPDPRSSKGSWRANRMRELNVARCQQLTDASFGLLRDHFLELESLNLAGCAVSAPLVAAVARQVWDRLASLDVSDVRVGSTDEVLAALGQGCPLLASLRVGWSVHYNDSVTDEGVANVARGCPSLRELSLLRCRHVTDEGVAALARGCPLLEQLDLSYCNFVTSVGLGHLAAACHQMAELRLAHCKLLGEIQCVAVGMPRLRLLDLHECNFVADEAVARIAEAAAGLALLDVVNCRKVTDRAMRAVQSHCPVLVALAIGGANKISDSCLSEFRAKRPEVVVYLHNNNLLALASASPAKPALYRPPKGGNGGSRTFRRQ